MILHLMINQFDQNFVQTTLVSVQVVTVPLVLLIGFKCAFSGFSKSVILLRSMGLLAINL